MPSEHNANCEAHDDTEDISDGKVHSRNAMRPSVMIQVAEPECIEHVWEARDGECRSGKNEVCHKKDKVPFIVDADALIYPWAVMVELEHAAVAYSTVMGSLSGRSIRHLLQTLVVAGVTLRCSDQETPDCVPA